MNSKALGSPLGASGDRPKMFFGSKIAQEVKWAAMEAFFKCHSAINVPLTYHGTMNVPLTSPQRPVNVPLTSLSQTINVPFETNFIKNASNGVAMAPYGLKFNQDGATGYINLPEPYLALKLDLKLCTLKI